jgi:hypothetical protein
MASPVPKTVFPDTGSDAVATTAMTSHSQTMISAEFSVEKCIQRFFWPKSKKQILKVLSL